MSKLLNRASGISIVATLMVTLFGAAGSSAAAEHAAASRVSGPTVPVSNEAGFAAPAAQPLTADVQPHSAADEGIQPLPRSELNTTDSRAPAAVVAASLEELVAEQPATTDLTGEMKCLAGAIYFEAKSESLEGQLAVGRVIIARTKSGRFPSSYCGVVTQPSQFSFVHGSAMPSVDHQSRMWQRAVALARIADAGSWQSPAEGALFFHAARVSPGWRMTKARVTQIDHHIFYR